MPRVSSWTDLVRPGPGREQPGDHRQHEHVAERVGDRDAFLQPRQPGVVHIRAGSGKSTTAGPAPRSGSARRSGCAGPGPGTPPDEDRATRPRSADTAPGKSRPRRTETGPWPRGSAVRTRKLTWPAAKLRFAAASSSHGVLRAGRLMTTPGHDGQHTAQADQAPRLGAQTRPSEVHRDEQRHPDEIAHQHIPPRCQRIPHAHRPAPARCPQPCTSCP